MVAVISCVVHSRMRARARARTLNTSFFDGQNIVCFVTLVEGGHCSLVLLQI